MSNPQQASDLQINVVVMHVALMSHSLFSTRTVLKWSVASIPTL
jgi:hypothetical protein